MYIPVVGHKQRIVKEADKQDHLQQSRQYDKEAPVLVGTGLQPMAVLWTLLEDTIHTVNE